MSKMVHMSNNTNTIAAQKPLKKKWRNQERDLKHASNLKISFFKKYKIFSVAFLSFIGGILSVLLFLPGHSKLHKNKDRPVYSFDYFYIPKDPNRKTSLAPIDEPLHYYRQPLGFGGLFTLSDEEIEHLDLGVMNLLCAQTLPDAKELNVLHYKDLLDLWTEKVRERTEEKYFLFNKDPGRFYNSPGYFKMLVMATVLQEEFKVGYNRELDGKRPLERDKDSRDLFIHGILDDKKTGTCASLPVIYVVIGQRLGYPVQLAITREHVYARWVKSEIPGNEECFNIEVTNQGMMSHSDEYYQNWPWKLTKDEIQSGQVNRTINKLESFALFLNLRANCLKAQGNPNLIPQALFASAYAHMLAPQSPYFFSVLMSCVEAEMPMRRGYDFSNTYQGNKVLDDFVPKVYIKNPVTNIRKQGNATLYTLAHPLNPKP